MYQAWRKVYGRTQMSGAGFIVPAVGGGSSPTDVTGLVLWLKADALSLANNDPVASWPDSSGLSHNGTGTGFGDTEPTFKTNVINSTLPAVWWDGAKPITFGSWASAYTAAEIFVVVKLDADPPTSYGLWDFSASDASVAFPYSGDGHIYDGWGSTTRKDAGNPTPSMASWHLYNVRSAANDWECYLDGASLYSTATNTVTFRSTLTLGQGQDGQWLAGHIAEVIMYNKGLTSGERSTVKSYISSKYGLTLA